MFQKTKTLYFSYVLFFIAALACFFSVGLFSTKVFADTYQCDTPAQKQVCTDLLNQTEKDISNLNSELSVTKNQGQSLQRDIDVLTQEIKISELKIKQHNISIAELGKDIVVKANNINTLQGKIDDGKQSLGQIIRQTRQLDDFSLPEAFIGTNDISLALKDLDSFDSVHQAMQSTFTSLQDAKTENQTEKDSLSHQRDLEVDAKINVQEEKAKIAKNQTEQKRLLALNKSQQASYKTVIASKSAQAAQIRAALFKLAGAAAIPFEVALKYARAVQVKTGVDPAFLLAILKQESNLGANVGACYLSDITSGAGVNVSSGKIWSNLMKPSRDVQPFLNITSKLGFDPLKTKVSCPIAGAGGYGGAMGPAQFIPSTWKLFESRISAESGNSITNPWAPEDAFMASALYLSDLGASGSSYSAQIKAACKYYGSGGSTCSYGRSVMSYKTKLQSNIDLLN